MHKEKIKLYEARVDMFLRRISDEVLSDEMPFEVKYFHSVDPVPFKEAVTREFRGIEEGTKWGDEWESAWFRLSIEIPEKWRGANLAAHLDFNGEALIFDDSGCPVYGLTNTSVFDPNFSKRIYRLSPEAAADSRCDLLVETAANHLFGITRHGDPKPDNPKIHGEHQGVLKTARLALFDEDIWHLKQDVDVFNSLMISLPKESVRRARISRVLNLAVDAYGNDRSNAKKAREVLEELSSPANASDLNVTAVGHAHIDTGWLWPVRESIRKCARTFSSQIALLEKYPDYVFGASQAQHYLFVKDNYPALYEKIKKYVKEGRWEIQGATWVECDCNIISGESMVRQFLHGKNFYLDEFDVEVRNLWLPDVFGYSAAIPQIAAKTGVNFFLTQKISWNQFNEFPHNTFAWRGIDGTEMVTHFPPENTYNSTLRPESLIAAQERFTEKAVFNEFMSLFGIGDGGGGPSEEYVERGVRQKNVEGCPKVKFGRADEFFDVILDKSDDLDSWVGELYLELHRGTYTTQAKTKKGNRKLENALRSTEFIRSCMPVDTYPIKELDSTWKTLLMNQFHDILPGSSIHAVYEQAEKEYAEGLELCANLAEDAASAIFAEEPDSVTLVNVLSHPYERPVALPKSWNGNAAVTMDGEQIPTQLDADGAVIALVSVPPTGAVTLKKSAELATQSAKLAENVLENDLVKYEFDDTGAITSCFDKELGREFVPKGEKANQFKLHVDRPVNYDAWDIDFYHYDADFEPAKLAVLTPLDDGPAVKSMSLKLEIGAASVSQKITLAANSKRIEFETKVDWRERHSMLRVSFPTTVRSSEFTADIQYGHIKRPTHQNTTWEMAKFETSAIRYVDISNNDYGAALMNDCKYGHKVFDNVIELTLLRAPTEPDPVADQGEHSFTYAFLPHAGIMIDSSVIEESAALNNQPAIFADRAIFADFAPPVRLESTTVSLETLKRSERSESWIARVVETRGRESSAELEIKEGLTVLETDLMERPVSANLATGGKLKLNLKPFEIKTFELF